MNESEGSKVVDGKYAIGRVSGQFFVPGGKSGNNRFYPEELWESVLGDSKVKARLEGRTMFGMVGHEDKPVTEDDIAQGRVSHIITRLWIDPQNKNVGMGEALILNTPAGRNLLTCFKVGSKLKTSSRASGDYAGQTSEGIPIVDLKSYVLETFDFVINPGFKEVNPKLLEGQKSPNKKPIPMEPDTTAKGLMESRDQLQKQLIEALAENRLLREEVTRLKTQNPKHEQLTKLLAVLEEEEVQPELVTRIVDAAAKVGLEPTELVDVLTKITARVVDAIQSAGKPDGSGDVNPTVEESLNLLKGYRAIGTIAEINRISEKAGKLLEAFTSIAKSPDALRQKLKESGDALTAYKALGTIDEIKAVQDSHKKAVQEAQVRETDNRVRKLSEELKQPLDVVRSLVEAHLSDKAIQKTFAHTVFRLPESKEDDDGADPVTISESSATRLFQSMLPGNRQKR